MESLGDVCVWSDGSQKKTHQLKKEKRKWKKEAGVLETRRKVSVREVE